MKSRIIRILKPESDIPDYLACIEEWEGWYVCLPVTSRAMARQNTEPVQVSALRDDLLALETPFSISWREILRMSPEELEKEAFGPVGEEELDAVDREDKPDGEATNEPLTQTPEGEFSLVEPPDKFFEHRAKDLWVHRTFVVELEDHIGSLEEAELLVREIVWKREKRFQKLSRLAELDSRLQVNSGRATISDDVKAFVWRRDQGQCVKCGSNEKLEFDHIIPVSKGGANTARNLQLLCEDCNRSKGDAI